MKNQKVKCSNFEIANDKPFTLISGPCQLENETHAMKISTELKKITFELMKKEGNTEIMQSVNTRIFNENDENNFVLNQQNEPKTIEVEESLSLFEQEKRLVEKSLLKHKGKRKDAAAELGISERTLYRKLKEFGL